MRGSTKRVISVAIAMFLFIGALLVYASFIKPAYVNIKEMRAELAAQETIKNQLKLAVEQIQRLLAEYQDVGLLQETTSAILPTGQALPQAMAQLTGLAENNALIAQSFTSQPLVIRPSADSQLIQGLGVLRFNAYLVGSYESFKSFLRQLETNIRLMDLVDLKMSPIGSSENNIFSYIITVDTYYQSK